MSTLYIHTSIFKRWITYPLHVLRDMCLMVQKILLIMPTASIQHSFMSMIPKLNVFVSYINIQFDSNIKYCNYNGSVCFRKLKHLIYILLISC